MMYLVPKFRDWQSSRRLTALVLVVMSVLMIFPIALPVSSREVDAESEGKDLSAPFPCQNRPCGCKSAKQCWKKCCCFTNAQKLAWAKAHRVQPPAFVVEAAKRETPHKAVTVQAQVEKAPACCATSGSCHTEPTRGPVSTSVQGQTRKSESKSRFVIGIHALQCQGVDHSVFGQLVSLEPPAVSVFVLDSFDQGEAMPPLRCAPLVPCDQKPPTPPPRQAA